METHEFDFEGETFFASGESCEPCHGAGYGHLLANWQKSSRQKMETVHEALADARRTRADFAGPISEQETADSLLSEASYDFDLVRTGRPIHNIVYANELLSAAYDRLEQFFELTDPDHQIPAMENGAHVVPSACINCHSGIEEIDAEVFGLRYSHKRHLVGAGETCGRCHSNQRFHGELTVQRQDCLDCHHSQEERQCGYCHSAQQSVLGGGTYLLPLEEPDIMFAEEVTCRDCHELPDRSIVRPAPQRCADCHDDDYADIQREWLSEFATLRASVEEQLSRAEILAPSQERDTALQDIRDHLHAIDADGSRGSHNHMEQMRILEEDLERLESLMTAAG
jgi:hypothetical protein